MNVLNEAIPHLLGLIPLSSIEIQTSEIVNKKGLAFETTSSISANAHIQPLTPFELEKITQGTLDSRSFYNFWLLGDLAQVNSALNSKNSTILWQGRAFEVFSKDDWIQNGWIKVIASEKMLEIEPEPEPEPEPEIEDEQESEAENV